MKVITPASISEVVATKLSELTSSIVSAKYRLTLETISSVNNPSLTAFELSTVVFVVIFIAVATQSVVLITITLDQTTLETVIKSSIDSASAATAVDNAVAIAAAKVASVCTAVAEIGKVNE